MQIERFGIWVNEMDRVPRGYGVAWLSPWSARVFCVRVPFNRIAGWLRARYFTVIRPADDWIMNAIRVAHEKGYQRGLDAGREQGMRQTVSLFRDATLIPRK